MSYKQVVKICSENTLNFTSRIETHLDNVGLKVKAEMENWHDQCNRFYIMHMHIIIFAVNTSTSRICTGYPTNTSYSSPKT